MVTAADAEVLWIDAGAMSGGSRNQVEFAEDLIHFFTSDPPPTGSSIQVNIGVGTRWLECTLSAKRTTFNVDIWRLSLPTAERGGDDYPDRVLRFHKTGARYFQLTVADAGSDDAVEWESEARTSGTVGRTSGDRRYGLT